MTTTTKLAVKFYTTAYQRSHGTQPKGRGGWAFIVMDGPEEHETVFVPGSMTLAEAKKWMKQYCHQNYTDVPSSYLEVEVAP